MSDRTQLWHRCHVSASSWVMQSRCGLHCCLNTSSTRFHQNSSGSGTCFRPADGQHTTTLLDEALSACEMRPLAPIPWQRSSLGDSIRVQSSMAMAAESVVSPPISKLLGVASGSVTHTLGLECLMRPHLHIGHCWPINRHGSEPAWCEKTRCDPQECSSECSEAQRSWQ